MGQPVTTLAKVGKDERIEASLLRSQSLVSIEVTTNSMLDRQKSMYFI